MGSRLLGLMMLIVFPLELSRHSPEMKDLNAPPLPTMGAKMPPSLMAALAKPAAVLVTGSATRRIAGPEVLLQAPSLLLAAQWRLRVRCGALYSQSDHPSSQSDMSCH